MSIGYQSNNCYSNNTAIVEEKRSPLRVLITSFRPHREAYNGCVGELVGIPPQKELLVKIGDEFITFFGDELTPLNFPLKNTSSSEGEKLD